MWWRAAKQPAAEAEQLQRPSTINTAPHMRFTQWIDRGENAIQSTDAGCWGNQLTHKKNDRPWRHDLPEEKLLTALHISLFICFLLFWCQIASMHMNLVDLQELLQDRCANSSGFCNAKSLEKWFWDLIWHIFS